MKAVFHHYNHDSCRRRRQNHCQYPACQFIDPLYQSLTPGPHLEILGIRKTAQTQQLNICYLAYTRQPRLAVSFPSMVQPSFAKAGLSPLYILRLILLLKNKI